MTLLIRSTFLSIVAAVSATFALPLVAQEDQGTELEEIVVTGSYLYTGADSAIFGSDPVAGVVNFVTNDTLDR